MDITAYISRANSFGTLHHADRLRFYNDPQSWFTSGALWTYEYRLREEGLISTPIFTLKK